MNEFETAMVNEPSVFEPLKSHWMLTHYLCSVDPYQIPCCVSDMGLHSLHRSV